ncbi:ATP-binding protein [Nocardia asiatica]|uniref:ATP-binding protein n=1 Tax=Nocardia asiatica TaxID=209252 RepID=UPI0024585F00|nr:ATP-binding protein [Nocardia asiatica]
MVVETDVVDVIQLKPDAGLVKSLGAHHTLESAIADLVDNCLDAEAVRISIRLLTRNDRLVQVEVVDNGKGMDAVAADKAMTLGLQRDYGINDLGHFGVGLKAASFSHSDVLTVWSSKRGAIPVGRRIRRTDFSKDFSCERLSNEAAAVAQEKRKLMIDDFWGTTIVWSELRSAYRGASIEEARTWMAETERKLRSHLGVTFHRLIEKNTLEIDILVDELEYADDAISAPVKAINPFGYANSGRPGYPKTIMASSGSHQVALQCHIWPAKTDIPGFRIQGKSGDKFQGFYIYRKDRLLQVGGWSDVANQRLQRQLARVIIDDTSAIGTLLTMNPEKAGLRFEPPFREALGRAKAKDGTTFDQFLTDAEDTYKTGNKRVSKRQPVINPSRGFAPAVRKQIAMELGVKKFDSLEVRWTRLADRQFFDIDFANSTLLLNQRYRYLFAPGGGSLNDAPLVKALMFLLTHHIFEGSYLGSKDKDNIALWGAILGTAVEVEEEMRGD